MSDEEKGQSWWQTLPGILTGITAIITAFAGLLVAINQTGWFGRSDSGVATRNDKESSIGVSASQSLPANDRERTADDEIQQPTATGGGGASKASAVKLPNLREYVLGDFVFTILNASLTPRNSESSTLAIRLRLLNNGNYPTNFWNRQFRLFIDNIPSAPVGDLNELVEGHSAKEGEVEFVTPQSALSVKLRIEVADEKTDIPLRFEN